MVVNGDDKRTQRWIRKRDFERFCDLMAERWFTRLANSDARHAYFAAAYSFYIIPGGKMGGGDRRQFDVFYGNRPVEHITGSTGSECGLPVRRSRFLVETGASLSYQRTERGTVMCLLSPARSEGFGPKETALILRYYRQPKKLQVLSATESHWRSLMSYFECTALDGDPQWTDHLRVWWLRFTCPLIVDGNVQTPKFLTGLREVFQWSLTVGLSGAILFALQWLVGAPPQRP